MRDGLKLGLLALALGFLWATGAQANEIYTFQQDANGYSGTQDTYLDTGNSTNYGSADALKTRNANPKHNALFRFDDIFGPGANQMPTTTDPNQIVSASLDLRCVNVLSNPDPRNVNLYEMLVSWTEGSVTGTGSFGGNGVQTDDVEASSTSLGQVTIPPVGTYQWDVTSSIKSWLAGSSTNYGWLLYQTTGHNRESKWASSERGDQSERPKLTVEVAEPAAVIPEPLTMLAVVGRPGADGANVRRRRS
jgi:hypothetical protein